MPLLPTVIHHDRYRGRKHGFLGQDEPTPPKTATEAFKPLIPAIIAYLIARVIIR